MKRILVLILIVVVLLYLPITWNNEAPAYRIIDKLRDGIIKHKHAILAQKLNIPVCHDNLRLLKEIMDRHNVQFMLSEGTALGMYRDDKLLDHDDDVDIAIWGKDVHVFLTQIKLELEHNGFIYSHGRKNFLSFFRNGEKIDISIIAPGLCEPGRCECKELVPHLQEMKTVELAGVKYNLPAQESYYEFLYSKNWRIPKADKASLGNRSKVTVR